MVSPRATSCFVGAYISIVPLKLISLSRRGEMQSERWSCTIKQQWCARVTLYTGVSGYYIAICTFICQQMPSFKIKCKIYTHLKQIYMLPSSFDLRSFRKRIVKSLRVPCNHAVGRTYSRCWSCIMFFGEKFDLSLCCFDHDRFVTFSFILFAACMSPRNAFALTSVVWMSPLGFNNGCGSQNSPIQNVFLEYIQPRLLRQTWRCQCHPLYFYSTLLISIPSLSYSERGVEPDRNRNKKNRLPHDFVNRNRTAFFIS